jgi:hypothetical protein
MLAVVLIWLAVVGLVMTGYALVWLLNPQLRAWMEAPRDQFLQQQRRFPRVVRQRPSNGATISGQSVADPVRRLPRRSMRSNKVTSARWLLLARPAALGIAGLSGVGATVWLWFFSADDASCRVDSLVAVTVLAALLGLMWYGSLARADRRWRAALDRYAEQEEARRLHSRRNLRARPQLQTR